MNKMCPMGCLRGSRPSKAWGLASGDEPVAVAVRHSARKQQDTVMAKADPYVAYWRKYRELAIAFLRAAERWKLFDGATEILSIPGVKTWHRDERGRWNWTERPQKGDAFLSSETYAQHSRGKQS